jgi:C-terminal processing protease CtpA/Prc
MLLTRLVARLRDGHARVLTTEATKDLPWPDQEVRRGPGMFWYVHKKKVYVKNAWGDAEKSGVRPGMEVIRVDGKPAWAWLSARVEERGDWKGYGTEHYAFFDTCHWGLAGPQNTRLKLELRRLDRKTKKATIPRTSRSYHAWGPVFFPPELKRIGSQRYGRTEAGYGYIHLRDTTTELPEHMDTMLAAIGTVPGLILDMRANGGGGTDHDALFGRFVPPGKTLSFGPKKTHGPAGPRQYIGPMVLILDGGVRSAGESVSGYFKEDGRAYAIGPSPTAGMSGRKIVIELPSKLFRLRVVTHTYQGRLNYGKGIEGLGIPPHEIVPYDPEDLAAGVDTQIRRAEELLAKGFPKNKVPYKPERYGWKKKR